MEANQENRGIPSAPRESIRPTDAKSNVKQGTTEDTQMEVDGPVNSITKGSKQDTAITEPTTAANTNAEANHKEEQPTPIQADEDDAVEY